MKILPAHPIALVTPGGAFCLVFCSQPRNRKTNATELAVCLAIAHDPLTGLIQSGPDWPKLLLVF